MVITGNEDAFFSRIRLGDLDLENRIVHVSPDHRRAPYGVVSSLAEQFYSERNDPNTLTISEPVGVSFRAGTSLFTPLISSKDQISAWTKLIGNIHSQNGAIFLQLFHPGRLTTEGVLYRNQLYYGEHGEQTPYEEIAVVGPSEIPAPGFNSQWSSTNSTPKSLTIEKISEIVEDFKNSALNAKKAGANGIELDAGGGFLIEQFLDPEANKRTDRYGIGEVNGFNFLKLLISEIAPIVDGNIGVHFSDSHLALKFADLQIPVAYTRLSVIEAAKFPFGLKQKLKSTKLIVSGLTPEDAGQLIGQSASDAAAFDELFTSNPDLRNRIRNNQPLEDYIPLPYGQSHGAQNYITYAYHGETPVELEPFPVLHEKKKVAIIGGGVSGMSAARAFLKFPHHDIDIFERRSLPGGVWSANGPETQGEIIYPSIDPHQADPALSVPKGEFPLKLPKSSLKRFSQSSVYPGLVTNVPQQLMYGYTAFRMDPDKLEKDDRFFVSGQEVLDHIEKCSDTYRKYIHFRTSVEEVTNIGTHNDPKFKVITRKELDSEHDYWEERYYDYVIVAIGHNWVPRIPDVEGLSEFKGEISHSAKYRGAEPYKEKIVLVVGSRESGLDIKDQILSVGAEKVYLAQKSPHPLGRDAYEKKGLDIRGALTKLSGNSAFFSDGTSAENLDAVIFATGYHYSFPFLSKLDRIDDETNAKIPYSPPGGFHIEGLFEHTFDIYHKNIAFVGPPVGTPTFTAWEKQAFIAALVFNKFIDLPTQKFQKIWEKSREKAAGDSHLHLFTLSSDRALFQESLNILAASYLMRNEKIDEELLRDWPEEWTSIFFKAVAYKKWQYTTR